MSAKRWTLAGWILFFSSGVFFLADALESGDKTALGSAITWLVGVVCFLVATPDLLRWSKDEPVAED